MNSSRKPVAVVMGATSKWQADGRNTLLAHGKALGDELIGPPQQRRRDRQPERLRGPQADHQLEFGRLLHGQVGDGASG